MRHEPNAGAIKSTVQERKNITKTPSSRVILHGKDSENKNEIAWSFSILRT